eukprot:864401-Rhodomonas_salina.4
MQHRVPGYTCTYACARCTGSYSRIITLAPSGARPAGTGRNYWNSAWCEFTTLSRNSYDSEYRVLRLGITALVPGTRVLGS